jgi:hypothetical protein
VTVVEEQTQVSSADEPDEPRAPEPERRWVARHRAGLIASAIYVLGGFWVFAREWTDVTHKLVGDGSDHQLTVWGLANAAYSVTHWTSPLFTDRLNVPDGVNMMANTSVIGLGIPMTPITLLFGPLVTYALLAIISLAGTAAGWYYVFSRRLVSSKLAAFVGGALCGFGPGMIAHSPGHMHIIAQFVLPFIALYTIKLTEPGGKPWRDGAILGLLVTYQVFIGEEMLLLAAVGCAILVVVLAVFQYAHRDRIKAAVWPMVKGAVAAGVVGGALLAYPLWVQFKGPQHTHGLPFDVNQFYSNVLAYFTFPGLSISGDPVLAVQRAANSGEENAFFGLPLMLLAVAIVIWLWRLYAVRVLAVVGVLLGLISLGNNITIGHRHTGIPGPFKLVSELPVVEMALPTRFSLLILPVLGGLLAIAADRVINPSPEKAGVDPSPAEAGVDPSPEKAGVDPSPTEAGAPREPAKTAKTAGSIPQRLLLWTAFAMALVPLIPSPVPSVTPPATPKFITSGDWKQYVPEGRTLVPIPLPARDNLDGMRWQAEAGIEFKMPRGFFILPDANGNGQFDAPPRHTQELLHAVSLTGDIPVITDADKAAALTDLEFWRAAVLVLPRGKHEVALMTTLDQLIGPGRFVDGCWIWDVRTMVD